MSTPTTLRRNLGGTALALGLLVGGAAAPVAAQTEEPDPGFPENGYSYPHGYVGGGHRVGELVHPDAIGAARYGWPPPTWLPHRGNDLYLQLSERKDLPLQKFRVRDEHGRPLPGVTVEWQQAGHSVAGVRGFTDAEGVLYVTVDKPGRSHRARFQAPGRRPVVLELSGGRLANAQHEIELAAGSASAEPAVLAYVPEQRIPPPREVSRAYRRGLDALARDRFDIAARELRFAVERWPLPSSDGAGAVAEYRPYEPLAKALAGLGAGELARSWQARGETLEHAENGGT